LLDSLSKVPQTRRKVKTAVTFWLHHVMLRLYFAVFVFSLATCIFCIYVHAILKLINAKNACHQ
jgi:hypothetical protein